MKKLFTVFSLVFTFLFSSGFGIAENNNFVKKEISQKQSSTLVNKSQAASSLAADLTNVTKIEETGAESKSIVQSVGIFCKEILTTAVTAVFQTLRSLFI